MGSSNEPSVSSAGSLRAVGGAGIQLSLAQWIQITLLLFTLSSLYFGVINKVDAVTDGQARMEAIVNRAVTDLNAEIADMERRVYSTERDVGILNNIATTRKEVLDQVQEDIRELQRTNPQ
jgi:hypothetical protein